MTQYETDKKETETVETTEKEPEATTTPEPSARAKEWAAQNTWFGNDEVMTNAAFSIHGELVKEGFDADSDDYYTEVNNRLKESFPHKFASTEKVEESKPVQTVASAGRKQQGRRSVKLTRSQVAIAKKLGVPLEEYAKQLKYTKEGA